MDNPLISIVTPMLNGASYIADAWDSVREQTWENWEWLVVDNGSDDESVPMLHKLAASDTRIKVFQQQIAGAGQARNVGLDAASGAFICFLDIDDKLTPSSLQHRAEVLLGDEGIHVVDGGVEIRTADLSVAKDSWLPSFRGDVFPELLRLNPACFLGLTWMIRRSVIGEKRFSPHLSHCEDLQFFISLGHMEYTYVEDVVLWYRTGTDSAMSNLSGLENGYRKVTHWLKGLEGVSPDQSGYFRKKARSIVFKSWLKRGKPVQALRSILKAW